MNDQHDEACFITGCDRPPVFRVTALGPCCDDRECCGWDASLCADHRFAPLNLSGFTDFDVTELTR